MVLFRSRDYPVGASDGYLFGVAAGDGKGGVDRSNYIKNYLSSKQENNYDEVDAITIRKYYEK